jgi:hypothetical protein
MDEQRIEALVRTAKIRVGRRDVVAGMAAGVVALLVGEAEPVAGRRHHRKLKRTFRCPGPADDTFSQGSGNSFGARLAQVFTASRSGSLRRIAVGMAELSKSNGDYVIQLVAVTGSPNGTPSKDPADVLAKVTLKDKNVPAGAKTLVASFNGPALVAGTEYAVVVERLGNTLVRTQVRLSQDPDGATCPNSRLFEAVSDGDFTHVPFRDMVVTVSVA